MRTMKTPNSVPRARVIELLEYVPSTGEFKWLRNGRGKYMRQGAPAGRVSKDGYLVTTVDGHLCMAHRLAWLVATGAWPTGEIDHIDGDKLNNRISNLRDVSRQVNQQNARRVRADSKVGVQGVAMCRGRPTANVWVDGKRRYIGTFKTVEQAHQAYIAAKRQHHEGCTL